MSDLEKKACLTPTWHGPHPWWWTDSDGGRMLTSEPTEIDHEIMEGLVQYSCPGKPEEVQPTAHDEPPVSEQTFEAFDKGVRTGDRQAIKKVYDALIDDGHEWGREGGCRRCDNDPCTAIEPLQELFKEAGIEL